MYLRTILKALGASVLLLCAADLAAQDSPAKRLASIAGVAVEEYTKGVDKSGRVFAQQEYEEATTFLADARALTERISDGRETELAAILDEMRVAAEKRVAPAELIELHGKLVAVLGPDAALDYPIGPVDLAGKSVV